MASFLLHFMSIYCTQPSLLRLNTGALLFNFTLGLKGIKINISLLTASLPLHSSLPPPHPLSQPHSAYSIDGRSIIDDDSLFLPISLVYRHISKYFQGSDKWRRRHSWHTLISYLSSCWKCKNFFLLRPFPFFSYLKKMDAHNFVYSFLSFHLAHVFLVSRCLYCNGRLLQHPEQMLLLILTTCQGNILNIRTD